MEEIDLNTEVSKLVRIVGMGSGAVEHGNWDNAEELFEEARKRVERLLSELKLKPRSK